MKPFRELFTILTALVVTACGDDRPAPVELCSPPPPEDCTIDLEQIPNGDVENQRVLVEDARDLEPFCDQACTRLDAYLDFQIRDGAPPKSLSPLRNIKEFLGISINNGSYGAPDFRGLESVERMRSLSVFDESSLTSLKGLESLKEVGVITLDRVPNLKTLDGLNGLERIDDDAFYPENAGVITLIQGANSLTSFEGLDSLASINGRFIVESNSSLTSFEGLESLRDAGEFQIQRNPKLRSLEGLGGVETASQLIFDSNPALPSCEIDRFAEGVDVTGNPKAEMEYWFFNEMNSPDCPSE